MNSASRPEANPQPPTKAAPPEQEVRRRQLLYGGAVLAGAAGVATVAAVVSAAPARAADGDPVTAGRTTTASGSTGLSIDAVHGRERATLTLTNPSGAALALPALPDSWSADLPVGHIANLAAGPVIGVDHGDGPQNAYLALSIDLDALSLPVTIRPERLLDTRISIGRGNILASSTATAFDATGRLRAGQWLDLAVAPTDQATIDGIFANLTVTGGLTPGHLTVYPGGTRPTTSSLNYIANQTIANGGLFATGITDGYYAVRVYTSATTHLLLDITGFTGPATAPNADRKAAVQTTEARRSASRRSAARRTTKALGRRSS